MSRVKFFLAIILGLTAVPQLAANPLTIPYTTESRTVENEGVVKSIATWPIFQGEGELVRFANETILGYVMQKQDEFVAQSRMDRRTLTAARAWGADEQAIGFRITLNRNGWISLYVNDFWTRGYSDPGGTMRGFTFTVFAPHLGPDASLVDFRSIMNNGGEPASLTRFAILSQLMRQPKNYVFDGEHFELSTDQMNNFVLEGGAIRWIFNPGDVARHSMGFVFARVPRDALLGIKPGVSSLLAP